MKKPLIIILGVVVLGGLVTLQLVRDFERATEVEVERLRQRDLRAMVSASGWLRPHRQVDISANTMGKVVELNIREGEQVVRGQVLLRIDPARYRGEVDQLRAALRAARADLQATEASRREAREALVREEALAGRGLSSRDRLDRARFETERAEATVDANRARVRRQEAALGTAEHDLDQVTVSSELDGIVTRLNVEAGENVVTGTMNNPGTVLLTIADLTEMEVRLEVDETDVVGLTIGQVAEVEIDAYPDTTFHGTVSEIGHAPIRGAGRAGETSADFEVVVRLARALEGMRPGLSASADIVTATRDDVLSVSIGALAYRDAEREARAERRSGARGRRRGDDGDDADDDADSGLDAAAGKRSGDGGEANGGGPTDGSAAEDAAAHDDEDGDENGAENGDENGDEDDDENDDENGVDERGHTGREVYGLFVIEDNRVRFTPVEIGITGERHFELESGVEAGTEVAAGPFKTLRELESGDKVKPRKRDKKR